MPSQNVGMHCPASANIMPPVSKMDWRRIAETSPRGRARRRANSMAAAVRVRVAGRRARTSGSVGC